MLVGSGSDPECEMSSSSDMEPQEVDEPEAAPGSTEPGDEDGRATVEEETDLTSMVGTRSASWMGAGGVGRRSGGGGGTSSWRKRERSYSPEEPRRRRAKKTKSKARPRPKPSNAPELLARRPETQGDTSAPRRHKVPPMPP